MNAPTNFLAPVPLETVWPQINVQSLRGQFLDSFLDFEVAISKALIRLNLWEKNISTPVGLRIEILLKADLATIMTKKQSEQIKIKLVSLSPAIALRNALIHGKAKQGSIDGDPALLIQSTGAIAANLSDYHVVTVATFEERRQQLHSITTKLDDWLNPPSPPQPKPDAAAGP